VINWWLFGCYTCRETTSVFGMFQVILKLAKCAAVFGLEKIVFAP